MEPDLFLGVRNFSFWVSKSSVDIRTGNLRLDSLGESERGGDLEREKSSSSSERHES